MEKLLEIVKYLTVQNIGVTIMFDTERKMFFANLDTQAKSSLYLYENGNLAGRYNEDQIDLKSDDSVVDIARELCYHFIDSTCGKNYYNGYWVELCKKLNIRFNLD